MIVNNEQKEQLRPYIEGIDSIVESDNIQQLLDSIDDIIINNMLAYHDEPDAEGIKLQRLYDEIYNQN